MSDVVILDATINGGGSQINHPSDGSNSSGGYTLAIVVADDASLPAAAGVPTNALVVSKATGTFFITYDNVNWTALS